MNTMIKKQVVSEILTWIEENLMNDIRIDDVVKRSGYSRRGIQLIFKDYTGLPLGAYIRHRKLCHAAALLRLTNESILDISDRLGFDSQASFGREFKKLFDYTPNKYRTHPDWDLRKFKPQIVLDDCDERIPSFRYLSDNTLFGYRTNYQEPFLSPDKQNDNLRFQLFMEHMKINQQTLFLLFTYKPTQSNHNMLDVDCILAFEHSIINKIDTHHKSHAQYKQHDIPGGLYAMFPYEGDWAGLAEFSKEIYTRTFPAYGLSRSPGYDIEIFYYNDTLLSDNPEDILIECDYYIPIHQ